MLLIALLNSFASADTSMTLNRIKKTSQTMTVKICKESPIKKDLVEKAIRFWNNFDKNLSEDIIVEKCKSKEAVPSVIKIYQDHELFSLFAGMTKIKEKESEIVGGSVRIHPDEKDNLNVVIHEIGHALGYDHAKDSDTLNIMNPYKIPNLSLNHTDYKVTIN